jgi:hypothetical protein
VTFVEALYAAGATNVAIGNILMLPNDRWAPYADMLLVELPADHAQRREVFDLVEKIGRRDDEDEPLIDCGQSTIRFVVGLEAHSSRTVDVTPTSYRVESTALVRTHVSGR